MRFEPKARNQARNIIISSISIARFITIVSVFVFSKHRPFGPMLSISWFVRPSVCLCVCLSVCSLLRYRLTVFFPPLPEVGCPIFLEIRNPWGKVMERCGLTFKHFCLKVVSNRRAKKSLFFCWFCRTKHVENHASRYTLRPEVSHPSGSVVFNMFCTPKSAKMFKSETTSFHYFSPRIPNL